MKRSTGYTHSVMSGQRFQGIVKKPSMKRRDLTRLLNSVEEWIIPRSYKATGTVLWLEKRQIPCLTTVKGGTSSAHQTLPRDHFVFCYGGCNFN